MNKVVARFADGRVVKGTTLDFSAEKDTFHVIASSATEGWERTEVVVEELKALFYVKDFAGDPKREDKPMLSCDPEPGERAVGVTFRDGEVIVGTTPRHRVAGRGFFLVPADTESNNERCFVVLTATQDVSEIC